MPAALLCDALLCGVARQRTPYKVCLVDMIGRNVFVRVVLECVWLDLVIVTWLAKLDLMVTFTLQVRFCMVTWLGHCDTIRT